MSPTNAKDRHGIDRRIIALVLIILCCHLAVASISRHGIIQDDAESYVLIGKNLARGNGFAFGPGRAPTSWRAPGYPALLALVFSVTDSPFAARAANAFLWAITSLLVFFLARRTVGERYALTAAGLVGLSPTFLGFTGLLWSESLFIALFIAAILGLCALRTNRSPATWILTGILVGSAILTRSTAVTLIPAAWVIVLLGRNKTEWFRALIPAAVATALALVTVGSWTARNWSVHHRFIPVESNTGFNLFAGQQPNTPIPFAWKVLRTYRESPAFIAVTKGKNEAEQNVALQRAAIDNIKARPLRALALAFGKTFDFWLPDFFIPANVRAGSFGERWRGLAPIVLAITAGFFLVMAIASLRYIITERRSWYVQAFVLILALYTAPHALVYGASRYHEPLTPLLIILAAPVVVHAYLARKYPLIRSASTTAWMNQRDTPKEAVRS